MFIPFFVYVRHFLNHTIVFLALPLAQHPRQPPGAHNGSAGTEYRSFLFEKNNGNLDSNLEHNSLQTKTQC